MEMEIFEESILERCKDKKVIFIFLSKCNEPETRLVIAALLEQKKKVVVPVMNKQGTIDACRLESLDKVKSSAFAIDEPIKKVLVSPLSIDIFFVPGTMFDLKGGRKGRGGGHFDRFLKNIKGKRPIIGLCYSSQLVKRLVLKKWDVPVDDVMCK